ncbi:MAG TPA: glutathione S-transferase family protein [Acetobacteraceae bacterium]|nr:glutathione S-transferase family protein [Acetobacteraceae bacterium]
MLKLWGRANSSNVMKVIWLLEELGLPYERVDVGGPFGGTATPVYRAMNPTGLVPTLEDGGFAMWESNAILRYLCDAHAPGTGLWPQPPKQRAEIDRWLDWEQTMPTRPMSTVFHSLVRLPPEKRDPAAIAAAIAQATPMWTMLDAQLADRPHVAGTAFTLADIALGPLVHRWLNLPITRPDLPHLAAWYQRLLGRPACVAHIAQPMS